MLPYNLPSSSKISILDLLFCMFTYESEVVTTTDSAWTGSKIVSSIILISPHFRVPFGEFDENVNLIVLLL